MLMKRFSRQVAAVALVAICALVVATHIEAGPTATHGDEATGGQNSDNQLPSNGTNIGSDRYKREAAVSRYEVCEPHGQKGHAVGMGIAHFLTLGISTVATLGADAPAEEWQRARSEHAVILKEHEPHFEAEKTLMSFDCSNVASCKSSIANMNNVMKSETDEMNLEIGGTNNSILGSIKDLFFKLSYKHTWTHATTEQTQVSQEFSPIIPSKGRLVMQRRRVNVDIKVPPLLCDNCFRPGRMFCIVTDDDRWKQLSATEYITVEYPAKEGNLYSIKYDYDSDSYDPDFYNSRKGLTYPTTGECQKFEAPSPAMCAFHMKHSSRSKAIIAVWRKDQSCTVCQADAGGVTYDSKGDHLFRGRPSGLQPSRPASSIKEAAGWIDEELCHFVVKVPRTNQYECYELTEDGQSETVVIAPYDIKQPTFAKISGSHEMNMQSLGAALMKRDDPAKSKDEDGNELSLFKHNKFHVLRGRPDLKVRMVAIGSEVSIGACGDLIIEKSGRVGLWQNGNCYTTEVPFVNKAQLYNRKGERLLSFTGELKQRGDELAAQVCPSTNEATWLQMQWNDSGNIETSNFNYGNEEHLHKLNFLLIHKE